MPRSSSICVVWATSYLTQMMMMKRLKLKNVFPLMKAQYPKEKKQNWGIWRVHRYIWIRWSYGYRITKETWWGKYGRPYCSHNWPSQSTKNHPSPWGYCKCSSCNAEECQARLWLLHHYSSRSTSSKDNFPLATASKQVLWFLSKKHRITSYSYPSLK